MKFLKKILKKNLTPANLTRLTYYRFFLRQTYFGTIWQNIKRRKILKYHHKDLYNELQKNGYVVIESYLNKAECAKGVEEMKMVFSKYSDYVQNYDDKRIFGIDQVLTVARKLAQDLNFLEIAEMVNKEPTCCLFTMGNWLKSGNNGSSGSGWHRDSFFSQFKALLYLTNVTEDNGPFEILAGSHHLSSVLSGIDKVGLDFMQNRISNNEVEIFERKLSLKRKTFTGNAGTLILFNSTTIHRGCPIRTGERLALTNYYYPTSIDLRSIQKKNSPMLQNTVNV